MNKKNLIIILRKSLIFTLLLFLCFSNFYQQVYAEDFSNSTNSAELAVEPAVTATDQGSSETSVDNNTTLENSIDQTADTGNNTINPTPEPTLEPTPQAAELAGSTPEPSSSSEPLDSTETEPPADVTNSAEVENNVSTSAETGQNSILASEDSQAPEEATHAAQINTGDAISVVEAENNVNSTEVNSTAINQTLNIFVSEDVNLAVLPYIIAEAVFAQNTQHDQVINVGVFNGNNYAYLSNDIVSLASSGANSVSGTEQATIKTGDAYSVVSLVNKVNTTFVDSVIHIVTINIFGTVNGNIILPEFTLEKGKDGQISYVENVALVENNVSSEATSGQNQIISAEGGTITTGDSQSVVNVVNFVNANIIGALFHYLFINNFGLWNGDFLGWDGIAQSEGGGNFQLSSVQVGQDCQTTCYSDINLSNQAYVMNNIFSTANSGGNYIGGEWGSITTGNSYSAISLLNFINTNIIRSIGFFGFINIFGIWNGDIGGSSEFADNQETSLPDQISAQEGNSSDENKDSSEQIQQSGGLLEVEAKNDAGTYYPGDTITFFVKVQNPGTGKVYNTKTQIMLIKDGVEMGGALFEMGDIEAGRGIMLTTGLVLSSNAPAGVYTARVMVLGYVGPDNKQISNYKDLTFVIAQPVILSQFSTDVMGFVQQVNGAEDLAGPAAQAGGGIQDMMKLLLFASLLSYASIRSVRERKKLTLAFSQSKTFLAKKSAALGSFFFSHFPPFF
ncbi:MAG: hypothetical protein PHE48_04970 [Candidatus Daviesbacteria bacterium]|nr:hypothetical protein [Candidatus Daviesbacteria bacterium]